MNQRNYALSNEFLFKLLDHSYNRKILIYETGGNNQKGIIAVFAP